VEGGARRIALPWAATALALFAVWLLFVDTREAPQLILGVGVAIIGATGSELVRLQRIAGVRPRPLWLGRLWRPIVTVPRDLWVLLRAAVSALAGRPPASRFRAIRFEAGDSDPEDRARQALAESAGSLSPNTIVVGIDADRRELLAHQLVPEENRPERSLDPLGLG
jgi:multisubunit Na+/H+ antiporter MnhE subunit